MKGTPLLRTLYLSLVGLLLAAQAVAAPRYGTRETALELAEVLDKGVYRNRLITSTFIRSIGKGQYFIKVVLDNGSEQDWTMDRIRQLSRTEAVVLKNNGALLFPSEETNAFVVLDKGRFAQMALQSKVYVKEYRSSDLLGGQKINFAVHRFNLVELLNLVPGSDELGYRHHYLFDLENGQRERLSYLDAYRALERGGLISDPLSVSPVLRAPYRLLEIKPHPLQQPPGEPVGHFAVEMVFDRPVELEPGHFPFQFFERPTRRGSPATDFIVEITAPNAVMPEPVGSIDTLEFLRKIHVVADPRNPLRLLLRASITPEVMDAPPEVEIRGESVVVTFTKRVDQSIADERSLQEGELRFRQERLLHRMLTEEEIERRRIYRARMLSGLKQRDQALKARSFENRVEILEAALVEFQEAALHASSDLELQDALRGRNAVTSRLPAMIIDHVAQAVQRGRVEDLTGGRGLLEKAALMTRDQSLLQEIRKLLEHPSLN